VSSEEGRGILPGTVNKQDRPGQTGEGRSRGACPATRSRKAYKRCRGRKSTGEGGRPTLYMSCKQTHWPAGAAAYTQQSGAGKPVKAEVGGKLHRREGKTHFPCEL
jgi:hypothetical protein